MSGLAKSLTNLFQHPAKENSLHALLASYKASDLLDPSSPIYETITHYQKPPAQPITLDGNMTCSEACQVLASHKISSAPIIFHGGLIGVLDMIDLVNHCLEILNEVPMDLRASDWALGDVLARASEKNHAIQTLDRHHIMVLVKDDTMLLDIVEEFFRSDAHRVVVLDKHQKFIGVISQSTIAALIVGKFGLRGSSKWEFGQKSVQDAQVISKKIVHLAPSNIVMEALFMMQQEKVSSVALLQDKKLVGSISNYDVKTILTERHGWQSVFHRCDEFFKKNRLQQSNERRGEAVVPNYTILPTCSVVIALEKMVATRAHRIWVVDEHDNCVGLVSLSSLMKLLPK